MQQLQLCNPSCRQFEHAFEETHTQKKTLHALIQMHQTLINLKAHTGEKSNKCNQYDFVSSHTSTLWIYLKMHSGEKSNICSQCDFVSSHAGNSRKHVVSHGGGKSGNLRTDLKCTEEKGKQNATGATMRARIHI